MDSKNIFIDVIFLVIFCLLLHNAHVSNKEYDMQVFHTQGKYLHFSLDDVDECMHNLSDGKYESIFHEPVLSILKQWHDKYGIVASLYVQNDFKVNSKYAKELIANSKWLKFGYHGNSESPVKNDMARFYRQVIDSIGSEICLDLCPRIHYFHADHSTCMKLKKLGCKGFLTCDDWSYNSAKRESNYYLSREQSNTLDKNNRLLDTENNIHFIKTDFRLEQIAQRYGSTKNLIAHYTGNIQANELIVFGHEWNFKDYIPQADSIFTWARQEGFEFDFPMNR